MMAAMWVCIRPAILTPPILRPSSVEGLVYCIYFSAMDMFLMQGS